MVLTEIKPKYFKLLFALVSILFLLIKCTFIFFIFKMDNSFDIVVNYVTFPESKQLVVNQAVEKWESIITGDIPDVTSTKPDVGVVDDLYLEISVGELLFSSEDTFATTSPFEDGDERQRGQGVNSQNPANFLPFYAEIDFKDTRINALSDALLFDIAFHEIGHALGFSDNSKSFKLLVDNTNANGSSTSDPRFTGEKATFWYNQLYNNQESSVPLETESTFKAGDIVYKGAGHWRERSAPSLGNEIMTPGISNPAIQKNVISKITIGAMEDLGYTVNYDEAEAEVLNSTVTKVSDSNLDDDNAAIDTDDSTNNDNEQTGNINNNSIDGTNDADRLFGGGGDDTIRGFDGSDLIGGDNQNDILVAGNGEDTVYGGSGNDVVYGQADDDHLLGESGNDKLYGEKSNDVLISGTGKDTLYGGDDNDIVYGQADDDRLLGESGNDKLYGEKSNDVLIGGTGKDTLYGGDDNDIVYGQLGDDFLNGENGNDKLYGEKSNDVLIGGTGKDTLYGGDDNDKLFGQLGDDLLNGGQNSYELFGERGNDTLIGGAGNDTFRFGINSSTNFNNLGTDIISDFGNGDDIIGLDKTNFAALKSITGSGFSNTSEFDTIDFDSLAATSNSIILYNSDTGNLIYNENGSSSGFGNGGIFANLNNAPNLTANSFALFN